MADKQWRSLTTSTVTEVAQVETITITAASTSTTATWTITLTDDDGSSATVTYTEDGSPTVAEIATGLFNNWNASTQPDIARITAANPSSGVLTLTADTAGRPVSISVSDDDDGTHTQSTSTSNRGVNDYGDTANWPTDAIPTTGDDVVFLGAAGALYGLNQSAAAIGDFEVTPNYSGSLGRIEDGIFHYLRIDPNSMTVEGSSQRVLLDVGSAAIAPLIRHNGGKDGTGLHRVYLKGSAITTLSIEKGDVGIAVNEGETTTITTLEQSYVSNANSDTNVELGSGVTITTVNQDGGNLMMRCAATTVNVGANAEFESAGSGAVTTLNVYGEARVGSSGTVGTANVWGTLDARGATVTNINPKSGGTLIIDDSTTVTNPAYQADAPGDFTVRRV